MFENEFLKSVSNSMIDFSAFHQTVKFVCFISQNKMVRMNVSKKLHDEYRVMIMSVATLK